MELLRARHDSVRFDLLLALAGEHLGTSPDMAMTYCRQALAIASATGRPGDVGEAEGWLGYIEEQRGDLQAALGHYAISLHHAEMIQDSSGIGTLLNNLGAIYKDQGRIEESVEAHTRSLAIKRAIGDSAGIATSLNNIGLILYDQGRIAEATGHFSEALRLYERIGDDAGVATALHNIAGIYRDQGDHAEALAYFSRALLIHRSLEDVYSEAGTEDNIGGVLEAQSNTADALAHYIKALQLHQRIGDQRGMGYSLRNIAGIDLKQGRPDSALAHARSSLEHLIASDDKRGQAGALWMAGQALHALGRHAEAMRYASDALSLARDLGYPQSQRDAAELLARLHRARGEWKDALLMQDLYHLMRDSVMNQDARRSAIRQQYRYAYEQKETALRSEQERKDLLAREAIQKERNRRNILLFAAMGVIALSAALWSRLRFVRRSRAMIQREKDRSEGLLLNILPEAVADELKDKGEAEARQFEQVTVLFTDFKGFTAMSEVLTPKDLVRDLHECFSAFDAICTKHGLEKIKTIGDSYMAAGGVPTPNATHAIDAIGAALDMRDFIAEGKARKIAAGLPYFEVRIGVHTGPVVAGIVGVKKFQYDIWGDTVNTASRMESSGEVGQVNISEATYALVKNGVDGAQVSIAGQPDNPKPTTGIQQRTTPAFTFTPRGKVLAKGKGEMEMYFVGRSHGQG